MGAERKIAALETARTASSMTDRTEPGTRVSGEVAKDRHLGEVFAGQYRIDECMGAGGMGAVYRGTQLSVDRPVAVKLIAPSVEQHAQHVQRFRREAEALAKLGHPNTVHLLDFGVTEDERLYIVMELLSGKDLEQLLAGGSLPLPEALRIVRQIAQSLSEAHALGIIHRDLKPSNVFLCHVEGGDSFVKVMDFGVAGFQHEEDGKSALTAQGTVLGTAAYMSPEQAQGFGVDARADLYSLGVVLFEMLAGRPPFQANSAVSLLIAHVSEDPPRLADVCPDLQALESVQALLDSLLAKDAEKRLSSATDVIAGVDALLLEIGEATQRPTGPGAWITRKRPRRAAAWPYAVVTMLLAAAAGFVWHRPDDAAALESPTLPQTDAFHYEDGWKVGREFVARAQHAFDQWVQPDSVQVTIASVPSGATVRLAGAELGVTPYELALKKPTEIQLDLPGHEPQTLQVDPGGEPNLVVKLMPLPPYIR